MMIDQRDIQFENIKKYLLNNFNRNTFLYPKHGITIHFYKQIF